MTDQEKAAWVVPTPEAAIQKTDRVIIVGNLGRVNQTMLQAMHGAGLAPHKPMDLQDDGKVHRFRVEGDKPGSSNRLLKYYPYGRTCSAAASAFVAAVSVF